MKEAANPVSNWIRNYGDFVIPKEQLDLMKKIVQQHSCKIPDSEVDATYRALRPLEELVGLLPPSDPQRLKMDGLLRGMKQMIDRKVQEYFRR